MSPSGRTVARIGVGAVGIVAALGVGAAVGLVQLPELVEASPSVSVDPQPADQRRACTGGVLVGQGTDGESFSTTGGTRLHAAPENAASTPLDGFNVDGDDAGRVVLRSAAEVAMAGALSQSVDQDGMLGLVTSSCAPARAENWLVAGSGETGRSAVIVLSNPGETDASVDMSFFAESGELEAPGATGIIVPAGQTRAMPLSAFVSSVQLPVVQVVARGSQISASIQSTSTRGLDPAGVDISGATAAASTRQTIAGLVIPDNVGKTEGEEFDDIEPGVRIFAPHADSATVTVTVSKDGDGAQPPQELRVVDGVVAEAMLGALDAGEYSVVVESDVPVVAAVRTTVRDGDTSEYAWTTAASPLSDLTAIAVPAAVDARLHVFNPGETGTEVTLVDRRGDERVLTIAAGDQASLRVDAGADYQLIGSDVVASISAVSDDGIASSPVYPASSGAGSLTVYPH
ncbi:DUF5719 family protein [Mycetocola reblochoni]|uniref:Large extracellular alpha-helical protein n=2 Tax=Mycetocola reblochoni TaxID=331618 RepID=A0A3L6ZS76_9MICO|nr:DUF5719 family protein [Mycetocola reblochoni]RLP70451.1 hypothetical protein D9V30_02790 [Mycetocola reblochoni]SJN38059.1 Putative secreted protein [Mycetocola reblochoni REB411]